MEDEIVETMELAEEDTRGVLNVSNQTKRLYNSR